MYVISNQIKFKKYNLAIWPTAQKITYKVSYTGYIHIIAQNYCPQISFKVCEDINLLQLSVKSENLIFLMECSVEHGREEIVRKSHTVHHKGTKH